MNFQILKKWFIITTIFITLCIDLSAQKLDFYKEIITIEVFEDYCTVDGEYFFHNDKNIGTMILYPFMINDSLSYPDSISILSKNLEKIDFKKNNKNIVFPFRKIDYFKAFYRQKTTCNYFEYILTTTQNWGKALQEADFIIKVHNDLELTNLSLPYNKISHSKDFTLYFISRKNYLPRKNIIIEWKEL